MRKVDNFEKALKNLKDIYKYEEPYDNVILTGLTALFEICFEQSWKAMKEAMEKDGLEISATGSPRMIIKEAYGIGMIEDEELWRSALSSRNDVTHSYNEVIAYDIVRKTKVLYIDMFEKLLHVLKTQYMEQG